jgi:hypothetical protein
MGGWKCSLPVGRRGETLSGALRAPDSVCTVTRIEDKAIKNQLNIDKMHEVCYNDKEIGISQT